MGSGGGTPSIGAGQGFFPTGPQMNAGGLQPFDLFSWANSGGTQAQPMGGGIFGQPQQAQPAAAPPPPGPQNSLWNQIARPGYTLGGVYGQASNSGGGYQQMPQGHDVPRYARR
jgi:hypothetical protein